MMESFGFFKNCCIKKPQIILDCSVGNKIAPKNTIKAIGNSLFSPILPVALL